VADPNRQGLKGTDVDILKLVFGPKCFDCSRRIGRGSRTIWCTGCLQKREEERKKREEERQKLEEEKRLQSPEHNVRVVLRRLARAVESKSDEALVEEFKKLCHRVETDWKYEMGWELRADAELSLINVLSSSNSRAVTIAAGTLAEIGFVASVPTLIGMCGSKGASAQVASTTLTRLQERLSAGWSTCPRCGSSSTTEGNATGWRCNSCDLAYLRHAGRDPLAFLVSGGFRGGPWDRSELNRILSEAIQGSSKVHELRRRAEAVDVERHRIVEALQK
jgi:hypothetical protein